MAEAPVTYKIYVGSLSWNTTDHSLKEAFKGFGEILDTLVMRDRDTGRSKGFGFVTFANEKAANDAINGMHEHDLDGRRIIVSFASSSKSGGGNDGSGGGYHVNGINGGGYNRGGAGGGGYY